MGQAGLGILDSYDVLDTASEAEFGAITRLAALALDAPIALVSLIDEDRQWFMSRYGIDVPQATDVLPFCAQAVQMHTPLVVADATRDPRFLDDPYVTGPAHVRFYAGVPLEGADGHVVGTLCAVDRRPRELTPTQHETLVLLAKQTMALLELRRVGRELRGERAQLAGRERELTTLLDSMVEGSCSTIARARSSSTADRPSRSSASAPTSSKVARRSTLPGARRVRTARRFLATSTPRCSRSRAASPRATS